MPRASIPTLLSLERYAQILGLDPMHFCGGFSNLRPQVRCDDIWEQYDWQDADKVSREQIARLVDEAERDLARELGYWPAPVYVEDEWILYPKPPNPELVGYGYTSRLRSKSVMTKWGYVICGGRRATLLIGEDDYTTLDADGDGFAELAKFEFTAPDGLTSTCEIRGYFKEYDVVDAANCRTDPASTGADPSWEVRPLRITQSGTTVTVYTYVWNLFRPQLQESLSTVQIDADVAASYVDELVFYREYTDRENQMMVGWGADITCAESACSWTTQAGCIRVKDRRNGIVVPEPGTWSDDDEDFTASSWSQGIEPDALRLWYRAGLNPASGRVLLDRFWAETIAMLATARLDWPLCTCSNVELLADRWRDDLAKITDERSYITDPDVLTNPFGTRAGEVAAWKRLKGRGLRKGQAILA